MFWKEILKRLGTKLIVRLLSIISSGEFLLEFVTKWLMAYKLKLSKMSQIDIIMRFVFLNVICSCALISSDSKDLFFNVDTFSYKSFNTTSTTPTTTPAALTTKTTTTTAVPNFSLIHKEDLISTEALEQELGNYSITLRTNITIKRY